MDIPAYWLRRKFAFDWLAVSVFYSVILIEQITAVSGLPYPIHTLFPVLQNDNLLGELPLAVEENTFSFDSISRDF